MSKYIYFQDGHVKGVNPSSRIDDYYKSWISKYKEIFLLAKKYKATGVIDGGDLLDIPNVANILIDEILDIIEENDIPVFTMWGNHTLIGHHKKTSSSSSLAHMFRRCDLLVEADKIEGPGYYIKCIDYDHNIEEKLKTDGIRIDCPEKNAWKIAIVHAFVTPKPFLEQVLHVECKDIVTNSDLVLVAHYHAVWNKKIANTEYLDIGCFGRTKISEANIEPSVLLLDTDERTYKVIKLKSAKKGSEIFDLDAKEELKSNDKEMKVFIDSLKDFKGQELDIRGSIEFIGKQQKISRPVIERILEKLTEVEK